MRLGRGAERVPLMEDIRRFTVEIEPDEDGVFIATVPALPGVVE